MKEPKAGGPLTPGEDEVFRRLATAKQALEHGLETAPQEKQRVLRERARALARVPQSNEAGEEGVEAVEFHLAHERYAIASAFVREIWPLRQLTPLPCTPSFVRGIVNVRGEILSVIDLRQFFDLPDRGLSQLNQVVLAQHGTMIIGILADEVVGVRLIPARDLQAAPPTLTGIRAQYTLAVTKERTVLLDAAKILSDERLIVREEVEI